MNLCKLSAENLMFAKRIMTAWSELTNLIKIVYLSNATTIIAHLTPTYWWKLLQADMMRLCHYYQPFMWLKSLFLCFSIYWEFYRCLNVVLVSKHTCSLNDKMLGNSVMLFKREKSTCKRGNLLERTVGWTSHHHKWQLTL